MYPVQAKTTEAEASFASAFLEASGQYRGTSRKDDARTHSTVEHMPASDSAGAARLLFSSQEMRLSCALLQLEVGRPLVVFVDGNAKRILLCNEHHVTFCPIFAVRSPPCRLEVARKLEGQDSRVNMNPKIESCPT